MKLKTLCLLLVTSCYSLADCVKQTDDLTIGELKQALLCFQKEINALKSNTSESQSITVNTHANLPKPTISKSVTVKNLQIDLHACERKDLRVTCSYTITNYGNDYNYQLSNFNDNSVAYDEFGIKYTPSTIKLLNQSHHQKVSRRLIKNVPVTASSTFENVPEKTTQFTVLNLTIGGKVEFRAIAIK